MNAPLRGSRIHPLPADERPEPGGTFLDECAAEARAGGWFVAHWGQHSTRNVEVLAAVAELGEATAEDVRRRTGRSGSAVDKALRELLAQGAVVVVGKRKWTRVYRVTEEELTCNE